MRSLERVNIRTNVRTYSHTYVRDRPYIPSTTLLCEGIKSIHLCCAGFLVINIQYMLDDVLSSSSIINLYVVEEFLFTSHTHKNHHFADLPLIHDQNLFAGYFYFWEP